MVAEQDLVPYEDASTPSACFVQGQFHGYQEFQRIITYNRLRRERPLRNNIFAFNASRTRFFPYQFKPLVKFLDSPGHRLLVCDEVGLGKTIEAGLILIELRARQEIRTALVVCPAGLRPKWQLELKKRFGEEFRILSARDFNAFLDDYEEAPDRARLSGIVSYETVRNPTVLTRLEDMLPAFDVVIADEAHHMRNVGIATRRAGVALSASAGAMLLLTATPVHLGNQNLFSLLNLLDDEDFPDLEIAQERFRQNEPLVLAQRLLGLSPPKACEALAELRAVSGSPWLAQSPSLPRVLSSLEQLCDDVKDGGNTIGAQLAVQRDLAEINLLGHIFTRTRKRDVQADVPMRRARALMITLTAKERAFYDAVSHHVRQRAAASDQLPVVVQWQLNSIQRRACSSIPALITHFRNNANVWGPDEDDDVSVVDSSGSGSIEGEFSGELARIVANWTSEDKDSKYEAMKGLITELSAERRDFKLLVFAFYRATLEYLQSRLRADGWGPALIHGDIAPGDRPALIEKFRSDPATHVLLSSRVGSEGLDFQFCDTMVNYDLPWNPMEVEQRIGRLDRIGQESPVIRIVNLWTLETIEERILHRLYERLGVFERSIGSLDPVLGDVINRLERAALRPHLSPEEADAEAERAAAVIKGEAAAAEHLESEAVRFIGADEYFREEVVAIQSNRRYVTGEQLQRFLADFIRVHAPNTRFRYDHESHLGNLVPDRALREFLKAQKVAGELIHFIGAGADGIPITFESQMAFESPELEFINVLHPLITAIVGSYQTVVGERVSAQRLVLRSKYLVPGLYVFVVYRLSVYAARSRHTIECVVLGDSLENACEDNVAEAVLGEMVELGDDAPGGDMSLEPTFAAEAMARAGAVFAARQQALRSGLEAENEAFVERRAASIQQSFGKNIGRVTARLESAVSTGKQDRYKRMLRGQLTRLETERDRKLSELQQLRAVQIEHEELTAGLLEVL